MHEIICPHCTKAFKIDEAGYADIVKQVHDREFEQQLHDRLELAEKDKVSAIELATTKLAGELQKDTSDKEAEILRLNAKLDAYDVAQRLAVAEALAAVEKERDRLLSDLGKATDEKNAASELASAVLDRELHKLASAKDTEIQELRAKLSTLEVTQKFALTEAVHVVEKERDDLKNGIEQVKFEKQLAVQSLKDQYEMQIREGEKTIANMRDMKARLSTKMIGETLEQHCETEFNRIRATAFQQAHFDKDNDTRTGSKGDYIFRDADEAGTSIVSIMFEMKNEADHTATKHKNEDFLKELDRDRNEKGCEYAVLVSLLEPDSELYNTGIVDVSHRYPKMYVIRPQFFIPIISLLRNAAMNALKYKSELALVRAQNIDVTNFENKLEDFKSGFARNYELASKQFTTAIEEIDKTITHLQKTKDALNASANNLRLANTKAQDVTIKRLTQGNQTMTAKFGEANAQGASDDE
jgi:hypothetical protein